MELKPEGMSTLQSSDSDLCKGMRSSFRLRDKKNPYRFCQGRKYKPKHQVLRVSFRLSHTPSFLSPFLFFSLATSNSWSLYYIQSQINYTDHLVNTLNASYT